MKKRKLKLKKQAYFILAIPVIIIVIVLLGINYYNDYKYKQTNEYKLIEHGYTMDDTKYLLEHLNDDKISNLLSRDKDDNIIALLKEKYFLWKNLDKYLEYYKKNSDKSLKDIISIINVHSNNKWYQVKYETDISKNELMLVNKFYELNKDYSPDNLENISLKYSYGNYGDNKLISYAYDEFINMHADALENGYYLIVNSSYRDYQDQDEIYSYRKKTQGERKADETAARPGHSEHQTGLVVDITSKGAPIDVDFSESDDYKWLQNNAYKYGFIQRYPKGKTYITGYEPESWHYRYVGKDAAKIIHDEDITFDEYYAYYIIGEQEEIELD